MYLLGYDIGSSSVKAALIHASTGQVRATAHYPDEEMPIYAPQPGWAEQHPEEWWQAMRYATARVMQKAGISPSAIAAIGMAYQMHGLVLIDREGKVLRPAIIWCDGRAVPIGERAAQELGTGACLRRCLNTPGNFTAAKLRWVLENEPQIFERMHRFMLPGDYLAYRMTGEVCTTITGLSEGVLWDFEGKQPAYWLLDYFGVPVDMCPPVVPVFGNQGRLTAHAAAHLGLSSGIPLTYRAGDQPNNAFALEVLEAGEVAATGGTSGVVYAVSEKPIFDPQQRVNSFAHVNYTPEKQKIGVLLCINGAGIQYSWLRRALAGNGTLPDYAMLEAMAAESPVGAEGLSMLPFGNGAERMLGNRDVGAHLSGLRFNTHDARHLYRAALEGIAFSFVYGMKVLRDLGVPLHTLRVGNDNLFQSRVFSNTVSTLMRTEISVLNTTGALGAAQAAGVYMGADLRRQAHTQTRSSLEGRRILPETEVGAYEDAYQQWAARLHLLLSVAGAD